ncbi:MAG: hypothetical protein F8N37_09565 [Telmatospirillum sp.]|nr:hypothetical protein [Telmatospirillum sp.]
MPIGPGKKFPINLKSTTPSALTPDVLKVQLNAVGLNCNQLTPQFLNTCITNVSSQLPTGAVQSFHILAPVNSPTVAALTGAPRVMLAVASTNNPQAQTLAQVADANWEPGTQAQGLNTYLAIIVYEDHFKWLYNNRGTTGFTGVIDTPTPTEGDYPNADAIQKLFVQVCLSASATVVKGLDQTTMQAILTNVIQPLQNENLSNFDQSDSRVIMLVENYNPSTGYADGVGVLEVKWRLQIQDYKRKSKDGGDTHHTILTVQSWSVLYSDTTPMCNDYAAVCKQFNIQPLVCPP